MRPLIFMLVILLQVVYKLSQILLQVVFNFASLLLLHLKTGTRQQTGGQQEHKSDIGGNSSQTLLPFCYCSLYTFSLKKAIQKLYR